MPRTPGARNIIGLSRRAMLLGSVGSLLAGCSVGGGLGSLTEIGGDGSVATPVANMDPNAAIKIAMLLPLSMEGETGRVANDIKQAGELALFELNRPNVALLAKDTGGTADGARLAAEDAIRSGAELILGPLFATEVQAVAPVAQQAGVPVVAFSSDRKAAGRGVYLLSFLAGEEVSRIVSYSASAGRPNIAALIPQTPYGDLIDAAVRRSANGAGARLVHVERYPVDASGMLDPMQKMGLLIRESQSTGAPVQALLLPGGQDVLPTIAPMLAYNNINAQQIKLLGTGGWDYPNIGQEPALDGAWFAAPDPAGWRDFSARYAKTYGAGPARIASLGYDAVSLAVSLSGEAQGQRYTPENLTRASGFAGADGLFRLRADGTSERGLAILEVKRFGPQVLDPAPSGFATAEF